MSDDDFMGVEDPLASSQPSFSDFLRIRDQNIARDIVDSEDDDDLLVHDLHRDPLASSQEGFSDFLRAREAEAPLAAVESDSDELADGDDNHDNDIIQTVSDDQ